MTASAAMRLGFPMYNHPDFHTAADLVVELEREGLDIAWMGEANGYDAATLLAHLAGRTQSVQLGTSILNIYSRTPALLAQTAAGLDYVSNGRAVLGLGASGPAVVEGWHGVAFDRPLARTREVVEICRMIWRRETLRHDGVHQVPLSSKQGTGLGKPLRLMVKPVRPEIPVYVAALGLKNVELAAEIADGWLPLFFLPDQAHEIWGPALEAGARRRDPARPPLDVVAGGALAIGDDVDGLLDTLRPMYALYFGGMGPRGKNFYFDLACKYGFEAEATKIHELFATGRREEAEAAVPMDLLRQTNLVGSVGFVRDRVAAFRDAGVTTLNVNPLGGDPVGTFVRLKELLS